MIEIRTTEVFDKWFACLKDRKAKARIQETDIAKAKEIAKQLEV